MNIYVSSQVTSRKGFRVAVAAVDSLRLTNTKSTLINMLLSEIIRTLQM